MIEIEHLTREFVITRALSDVTFTVPAGEVCGLIGPNGAGKTTLLKILATVIPPSSGRARICGHDVRAEAERVRWRIGYMPDAFGAYEEMRVDSYLEFFAHVYRLPRERIGPTIDGVLRLVDLVHLRNAAIARLSLGVKQRLSLGRALLHNPAVLLLDEPVSGLDPLARVEMRALLRELGRMGKTVLISSHVLSDLAGVCDRIAILEQGGVVFTGTIDELKRRVSAGKEIDIAVDGDPAPVREFLERQPWARAVEEDGARVHLVLADVAAALFGAGFRLAGFQERAVDLEEAYLRITRGEVS